MSSHIEAEIEAIKGYRHPVIPSTPYRKANMGKYGSHKFTFKHACFLMIGSSILLKTLMLLKLLPWSITISTRPMLIKIIMFLTHSQVEALVSYYKLPT